MSKGDKKEMTTLKVTREAAAKVSFTVRMLRQKTGNNKLTASDLIEQLIKDVYTEAVQQAGGIDVKTSEDK